MEKYVFLIIDTDGGFAERFNARLKYRKLDTKFGLINILPKTANKDEMAGNCIKDAKKALSENKIAAILVDIHLIESGAKLDTSGIPLAVEIKNLYPLIPVYSITGKVSLDEQLELVSDATMELNDGVIVKSYFEEDGLTERRLKKLIKPKYTKIEISNISRVEQPIASKHIDIAIITALYEDEFENIKPIFNLKRDEAYKTSNYHFGKYVKNEGEGGSEKEISVVATHQPTTGMVDAAILAADIILHFNPKYLLMTGVCGGKNIEDLGFGDIIVAEKVFTFQKGKITDSDIETEHELCEIDHTIISKIRENQDTILFNITNEDTSRKSQYKNSPLKLFIKPMACSTAIINKDGYFEDNIENQNRNTIAVDMESYSVARACMLLNNSYTKPIIVKSIMDKTKMKSDDPKSFAAYTSAQFVKQLLDLILF